MTEVTWYKGKRKPKKPGTYWVIIKARCDFCFESGVHEGDVWFDEDEFDGREWYYNDEYWELLAWCEPIVPPIPDEFVGKITKYRGEMVINGQA